MTQPPRFCPHCGTERRRADARFCHKCGQPLTAAEEPPVSPSPIPPIPPMPARPRGTRSLWLAGIVLVLATAIVAMILIWNPRGRAETDSITGRPTLTPTPEIVVEAPAALAAAQPGTMVQSPETPNVTPPPLPPESPIASVPPPTATSPVTPTAPPIATARPTFTSTPAATLMPSVVVRGAVNLRAGPGTDFERLRQLTSGEWLQVLGRNDAGDWLSVKSAHGTIGWVAQEFIDLAAIDSSAIAVVQVPSLPVCGIAADNGLNRGFQRSQLGCPLAAARVTWAAWQPFEHGSMLWRLDTNKVTIFYDSGSLASLDDEWDHISVAPSRGASPTGRTPQGGFGWIWGHRDEVFQAIGWPIEVEKGFCALVQDFERGFIYTKSQTPSCPDASGRHQGNRAAELPSLFIAAYADSVAWKNY